MISVAAFSSMAFASHQIKCEGRIGQTGKAYVVLTTAEDDNAEGRVSVILFSGTVTGTPVHYVFDVTQIQNSDSDSDVSVLYQGKAANSRIRLKINDNKAMGASYIKNLPGIRKIDLSCK